MPGHLQESQQLTLRHKHPILQLCRIFPLPNPFTLVYETIHTSSGGCFSEIPWAVIGYAQISTQSQIFPADRVSERMKKIAWKFSALLQKVFLIILMKFFFFLLVCQILNCQAWPSPNEIFDPLLQLVFLFFFSNIFPHFSQPWPGTESDELYSLGDMFVDGLNRLHYLL